MPHHYRRGDVSNTAIRAKLYSEGIIFDKSKISKHLGNKSSLEDHTSEALQFQKNRCIYCSCKFDNVDKRPQRDHIRPMEKDSAGLHCWGNILFCCAKCNKEKDKFPGGWQDYLASKPKAFMKIQIWQIVYDPGYVKSDRLIKSCQDLYLQIDKILRTHSIT